jgi:hypothetical protein
MTFQKLRVYLYSGIRKGISYLLSVGVIPCSIVFLLYSTFLEMLLYSLKISFVTLLPR